MTITRIRPRQLFLLFSALAGAFAVQAQSTTTTTNPFIYADVPDPSIIQVGGKYYMTSTTMHFCPGVPVMQSSDLVHWKIVSYAYNTLANTDQFNLNNGKNAYGGGSWASSLRYKGGTFYILVGSLTTSKEYLYSTTDITTTPWKLVGTFGYYHDASLLLDDDGRNYIVYGSGDIKIVELTSDLTGIKAGGANQTLFTNAATPTGSTSDLGEGSHIEKVNGYYYIFNICWPSGWPRTEVIHRSQTLLGTYTGEVGMKSSGFGDGVAQGSVVQMADSSWMGYLFTDQGSLGRSPYLIPVTWSRQLARVQQRDGSRFRHRSFDPGRRHGHGSGLFGRLQREHDEDGMAVEPQCRRRQLVSLGPSGYYRITTSRTDASILTARNTLTQRSFGPKCSGRIALDATGLKDGDIAGLAALQDSLGFVAVKKTGTALAVVMYEGPNQVTSVALAQNRVYLRIDMDFTNQTDKATFFYSLDSTTWKSIGNTVSMHYTLGMFVGYRFSLFDYATKTAGGYADFDWYKIGATFNDAIDLYQTTSIGPEPAGRGSDAALSLVQAVARSGRSISIEYQLGRAGSVDLFLVDSRGSIVDRASSGRQSAGSHGFVFDATGLPEGRYLLVGRLDGVVVQARPVALVD
jgi:beta-xylosidase